MMVSGPPMPQAYATADCPCRLTISRCLHGPYGVRPQRHRRLEPSVKRAKYPYVRQADRGGQPSERKQSYRALLSMDAAGTCAASRHALELAVQCVKYGDNTFRDVPAGKETSHCGISCLLQWLRLLQRPHRRSQVRASQVSRCRKELVEIS